MFSIFLPMQRISASMQKKVVELQSFRHYIHPALGFRTENDHVRSQKSVRVNLANVASDESRKSHRLMDDSQASNSVSDTEIIPLMPTTQVPSQQSPQPSTQTVARTVQSAWEDGDRTVPSAWEDGDRTVQSAWEDGARTVQSAWEDGARTVQSAWEDGDRASKMVSVIDAVVDDVNHRIVGLSHPAKQAEDTDKYRILVVDDSALNRKMLTKQLKSKGYR